MKTTKVKGFTLIELIVVMAIFGVIMAGAMSLMTPATKVMIQSETYENGNAAVTSISNYLEKSLASAEVLEVYNHIPASPEQMAYDFVADHYQGLLKDNSTVDSRNHADGRVHIMIIDNSGVDALGAGNTVIEEYTYEIGNFETISPISLVSSETSAINKAYYDSYDLQIKAGAFDSEDTGWLDPLTDFTFRQSMAADNMSFTVRAVTHPLANGQTYAFMKNTTFNVTVNSAFDFYYQVRDEGEGDQIKKLNPPMMNPIITYTTSWNPFDTYCFVYSYGAEINTKG